MTTVLDLDRLHKITSSSIPIGMGERLLKLSEESGEACSAYLAYSGSVNASKSETGTVSNLAEEVIDTIIVAYDILVHLGIDADKLKDIANVKLTKWESKVIKKESM